MAEHTPGPWEFAGQSVGPCRGHITTRRPDRGLTLIAGVTTHPLPDAEWYANARLIAAAPELLAALERLMIEIGEGGPRGRAIDLLPRKTIEMARAAIAKARGEHR